MSEPFKLKDQFGIEVAERIGDALAAADGGFDRRGFVAACRDGYDELELTTRGQHIAAAMAAFLPSNREQAIEILVASLGPELAGTELEGMAGFYYMPHGMFVANECVGDFEPAMRALYEITKRFTSEFPIRTFIVEHYDATMERLAEWVDDPNPHVRRLVSEGTRSRLPWSFRLHRFIEDPAPVMALLERLRHDDTEYVRRSVANNLNDIAKDHPNLVIETCGRWWADANADERRMIRHGLRTLIKAANPAALAVLGFGADSPATVTDTGIEPTTVAIGDKVRIAVTVKNPAADPAGALVDLRVHFVKANGSTSPKVFKGAELELEPGESHVITKTVSVRQHTTRTHYPGTHMIEVICNGVTVPAGSFELVP